jgi:myo-inositol-1(or 4)-monophosphatase
VIPTIEWMIEQAEAAGQAALAALPEMESEIKADATVVTNIDRMVETWLREKIAARFPDHGFFGEESGQDHLGAEFLWAIDPIDGTANMVHGLPIWAVSMGLLRAGRPFAGVVRLPVLGETYAATAGGGAQMNGHLIRALDLEALERDDTVGIGSEAVHRVDLTQFISRQRNFGAVAVHLAYTARGALRGNVSGDDKLYDIAAGMLIATEAGCRAEWLGGGAVTIRSWLDGTLPDDLLLVAPPRVLELLRGALREDDLNTKTRRHEEEREVEVESGLTGDATQDSVGRTE